MIIFFNLEFPKHWNDNVSQWVCKVSEKAENQDRKELQHKQVLKLLGVEEREQTVKAEF